MRATIFLALLCVTLAPAGEPDLSADFYAFFGSDFTRGQLDYADYAGDGDGLYFGNLNLRPSLVWEDLGNLRAVLAVDLDDVADPKVDLALYEVTAGVELPLVGELRAGALYIALGDGGRYNAELGGLYPVPRIYGARPMGLSLGRDFGGLYYRFSAGVGRTDESSDDSLFALTLGYADEAVDVALHVAADSKPYDVRNLFFAQYVSRAPGVRTNYKPGTWGNIREPQLEDVPMTRHDPLQTLALGMTLDGGNGEELGYHLTLAYAAYADEDPSLSSANLTGGSHLFLYPELIFRAGWFEAYVAGLVDYWKSNDTDGMDVLDAYGTGELISSTLAYEVYAEGDFQVTDNLRLALGGGYTEPSTSGQNISETPGDDTLDVSIFATPRVIWTVESDPAELEFTLGGLYRQWAVALYDVTGGEADESREITGWLRVTASF
ncbi:MAG TPA: hypothetical protein VM054_11040 [bacterium]|nr:hypothetical protein [bacterium]